MTTSTAPSIASNMSDFLTRFSKATVSQPTSKRNGRRSSKRACRLRSWHSVGATCFASDVASGRPLRPFPRETAIGSLCHYISAADPSDYQPANITFDLLPALDEPTRLKLRRDKHARHTEICRRAIESMDGYMNLY